MKHILLLLLICFTVYGLKAQNISVKSFRAVPDDMTARVTAPVTDQNGDKCALIKVRTSQKGFVFEGDMNGITKTKQDVGEVWIYLPQKSRRITIKHQQLGVLDKYIYPEAIKEASVYIMELSTGKVTTIVEQREVSTQWLIITSEPKGANIYINDEYKGVTTFQQELAEGSYSYRLEYPLYHNSAGRVDLITAEGKKIITVKLKGKFGDLKITSQPERGARVFLDGKDTNKTTPCVLRQVSSGNHSILLQREWYKPYNKQVVIEDEQMTDILANLQANYCSVQVTADHNAQIVVDGSKVGATSWNGRLLSGFHSFEAKKENFYPHKMKIDLVAGKEKIIKLSSKAILGNLKIMTTPFGAKIKLNGKNYGTTPNTIKDLLIGDYSMELSKTGYGTVLKTISIGENKTSEVNETLPSGKEVSLSSTPSGAKVYDGESLLGTTPLKTTLVFGTHKIRVSKEGETDTKQISIAQNGETKFEFHVEKFAVPILSGYDNYDSAKLKNDGNAALKAKDFKTAFVLLEKYLRTPEASGDIRTIFNLGYVAYKVGDYAKSVIYFDKAIIGKYKLSSSYLRKAISLKKLERYDEMVATLKAGIIAVPSENAKLSKTLAKHFLIEGIKAQKSFQFDAAEALYKKAIELKSSMKTDAIVSLGSLYFSEGAKIQLAAKPLVNTDKEKIAAEIVKAKYFYKKAVAQYTRAKNLAPSRQDIDTLIEKINALL